VPARTGSARAQAIGDLAVYEEARRLFEQLIPNGRNDLEPMLAGVCVNKALVHGYVGDLPGVVALCDQAIALYERLVHREGRPELANVLATTYVNKAVAVRILGDNAAAVALYDQAIAIRERLVHLEGRPELANHLAGTYLFKAVAVSELGD